MLNKNQKEVEELSNSSNIIGKGTIVNGSIETFGNIRVEGKVIGDIKTKSKAAFGHSSQVDGSVLAQNAEVAGHIAGTIEVTEQLVLKATATIDGDIITNKLLVESGATFNGKCKMGVKSKEIKIGKPEEQEQPQALKA
ncbi:protein CcmA, bactofilin family [Ekhidna lutea]|uniref:Protein CcmA, bactofilin family n=1 Tax=Ekhidna lutea TaxID=447679 RepID=A0A239FBA3_EKHLU|nr:polymer-forming cytoskeletal protein [Ekhidna lutea]SNS54011.1 protein CcmA, bactofilin family [Ekhidna lutea]